jgi:ABC-2 type transport system permease protein
MLMMIINPLLLMAFIDAAFNAEQAVPGMAVMFSMLLVGNFGFSVFREHGWNTWDRLRASWASRADILVGKALCPFLALAIQQAVLYGVGGLLFGLHIAGSKLGLVLLVAAYGICLLALASVALVTCRTLMQLNAFTNIGALLFAGLGGALIPIALLPGWAHAIAPITPSYWAMRGVRDVVLEGEGMSAVALPVTVLLCAAVVLTTYSASRFRLEDTKNLGWA